MPRKPRAGNTATEYALCFAMYHITRDCYPKVEEGRGVVWITGKGIAFLLGTEWTTYRRELMEKLEKRQWMHIRRNAENIYEYALTESAIAHLNEKMTMACHFTRTEVYAENTF